MSTEGASHSFSPPFSASCAHLAVDVNHLEYGDYINQDIAVKGGSLTLEQLDQTETVPGKQWHKFILLLPFIRGARSLLPSHKMLFYGLLNIAKEIMQ